MKEIRGIISLDYDGTLANDSIGIKEISKKTVDALMAAREKGYLVLIASGRCNAMVRDYFFLFDGYITSNGSYVNVLGKEYKNQGIDVGLMRDFIDYFEGKHDILYANFETPGHVYATKQHTQLDEKYMKFFGLPYDIFSEWDGDFTRVYNKSTFAYNDHAVYEKFEAEFGHRGVFIDHAESEYSEFTPFGCTKGAGLEIVMKELAIPKDAVYAMGDSANDYEMLKVAGHGVAMKDHNEILDEVAEMVTQSVANHGVAVALESYGIV